MVGKFVYKFVYTRYYIIFLSSLITRLHLSFCKLLTHTYIHLYVICIQFQILYYRATYIVHSIYDGVLCRNVKNKFDCTKPLKDWKKSNRLLLG